MEQTFRHKSETGSRNAPKGARAAEAAARTYLRKNLGWLRGFPAGLPDENGAPWITLPDLGKLAQHETLLVTRERLRRTEFSRNAARRKFPQALAQIVGDVDEWSADIDRRLKWLKAAVHSGKALPNLRQLLEAARTRRSLAERVVRLTRRCKALTPLVASLVWIHWADEAGFLSAFDATEKHAAAVESVLARLEEPDGLMLALRCVQLLADGCDDALITLLADRRCWEVPLSHDDLPQRLKKSLQISGARDAEQSAVAIEGLPRPVARLGRDLADFTLCLATQDKAARGRRLQFLQALAPEEALADWERWWTTYDLFERRTRSLLNAGRRRMTRQDKEQRKILGGDISAELTPPPPLYRWRTLSNLTDAPCATASAKAFSGLIGCLGLLSGSSNEKYTKEIFLEEWGEALKAPEMGWGVIEQLLSAQRGLLEQLSASKPEAKPWICQYVTREMIETWINEEKPQRLIEPTMEALSLLMQNAEWPSHANRGWGALIAAVEVTGAPAIAAAMLAKAPVDARHGEPWTALLLLSGGSAARLEALAKVWQGHYWTDAGIKGLAVLANAPDVADFMAEIVICGEGKRLGRLAAQSALVRALAPSSNCETAEEGPLRAGSPGEITAPAFDLTPYPAELHGALLEMARLAPDAARSADRILSPDFPLASRLTGELAFLRDLADGGDGDRKRRLLTRIANLEARLEHFPAKWTPLCVAKMRPNKESEPHSDAIRMEKALAKPSRVSEVRLAKYRAKLDRRIRHFRLLEWERRVATQLAASLEAKIGAAPPQDWLQSEEIIGAISALAGLPAGFQRLAFRLLKTRCGPEPWDLRAETPNSSFLAAIERRGIKTRPWLDGIGPRDIQGVPGRLTLDLEKDPLQIMRMGEMFETCLAPGSFNFFSAVANAADINKRVLYARNPKGVIQGRCLLALTDEGHLLIFRIYAHAHAEAVKEAVTSYVFDLAEAMGTAVATNAEIRNLVATRWYDDGPIDLTGQLAFLKDGSEFMTMLDTLAVDELIPALERYAGPGGITPGVIGVLAQAFQLWKRPELAVPLLDYLDESFVLSTRSRLTLASSARRAGKPQAALAALEPLARGVRIADTHDQSWIAQELIELGQPDRALRLLRQSRRLSVRGWSGDSSDRVVIAAKAMEALRRPRKAMELYRIAGAAGDRFAAECAAGLEKQLDAERADQR
jgi:YD repeat-containing protein